MAWQRKTPFGYAIQGGALTASPTEAEAVNSIFTLYLSGLSYSQIAEEMMRRGVHYHAHTPEWNKHMVGRILENQKYLGAGGYPRLVSDEDFLGAQLQREEKNTYAPCPAAIKPIREKCRCGACGARMIRDTRSHGRPRWRCENDSCGSRRCLPDEDLRDAVAGLLRELSQAPHLLRLPAPRRETSLEPVRLQNEINHEFNQVEASPEYLKVLILACATEKYNELTDPTPQYRLRRLRERLEDRPADEETLRELFDQAVRSVRIGQAGAITLELPDGQIFEREEARQ